jgi:SAM-dependent methyltransferase
MKKTNTTIDSYKDQYEKNTNVNQLAVLGENKEFLDEIMKYIPKKSSIIEVGSGIGRDALYFQKKGYNVTATEVIKEVLIGLKNAGLKTKEYNFLDTPKSNMIGKFDCCFCHNVLKHANELEFAIALSNISIFVKEGGVIAFNLENGEGQKFIDNKHVQYYTIENILEIMVQFGIKLHTLYRSDNQLYLIIKKEEKLD